MSSTGISTHTRNLPGERMHDFLNPEEFRRELDREKHRTDRSESPFTLMLFGFEPEPGIPGKINGELKELASVVQRVTRASDCKGWFLNGDKFQVGVLMPDTKPEESAHLYNRVRDGLRPALKNKFNVTTTVYTYPAHLESSSGYRGLSLEGNDSTGSIVFSKPVEQIPMWKRSLDVIGALMAIILLSPIWIMISLFIKLVSPGPVFFKQKRVGMDGKYFMMIKFRTMSVKVDPDAHRRYVETLIRSDSGNNDKPMVKLENRPEIIPGGKIIRSLCLDEIPQLLNVLKGEMSLVGPRPAMEYEVQQYADWHHKRLNALPGMTGLWQVSGKNRLTFNEMVRLDIRYTRQMSLNNDLKILVKTIPAIMGQLSDMFWKEQTLMEKVPENA